MNPSSTKRAGVLTLRTLGRGFWLGILASLALHGLLLTSGQFQLPHWNDETVLEARLEPVEFKAVAPLAPQVTAQANHTQNHHSSPSAPPQIQQPVAVPAAVTPPPATPVETSAALPVNPAPSGDNVPAHSEQPNNPLTRAGGKLNSLPTRIEIVFELNGTVSGRQTHHWLRDGQRYTLETTGEVTGLAGLFVRGKLIQTSRGRIGDLGLMPEQYEMQRLNGKKETLSFDYDANLILSNNGKRNIELPLLPSAQDPLSAIYQLAMAAQDDSAGLIVAASAKHVKGYPYHVLGTEKLDTALGSLKTLHVVRTGDSGKDTVNLWLSPEHHYLPVRVAYTDEDGTAWVLEATRIKAE